jgi:NTP pyrophosphatase (non-canonical NTP hydrolase)
MSTKPVFMSLNQKALKNSWQSTGPATDIDKIQQQQKLWAEYNFPENDDIDQFLGVVEEVGELAHAILKLRQGIRLGEDHRAKEKDAIGDILIFLLGYCNDSNLNLLEILENTWGIVVKRDWQAHRKESYNGT